MSSKRRTEMGLSSRAQGKFPHIKEGVCRVWQRPETGHHHEKHHNYLTHTQDFALEEIEIIE